MSHPCTGATDRTGTASGTCGAAWSARRPVKPEVAGSNPVRSASLGTAEAEGRVAQLAERAPEKREVTGSTPVPTTTSSLSQPSRHRRAPRAVASARGSDSEGVLSPSLITGEDLANPRVGRGLSNPGIRRPEPGEILVSETVPRLVTGSGIEFDDRGERELKGVPGTWRLYRVVPCARPGDPLHRRAVAA